MLAVFPGIHNKRAPLEVRGRSARAGPELRWPSGAPSAVHQRAQQVPANLEARRNDRKVSDRFTKATPSSITAEWQPARHPSRSCNRCLHSCRASQAPLAGTGVPIGTKSK